MASEPLHWKAWSLLLGELGIPYVESELQSLVGTTAPQTIKALLDRHRPGWDPAQLDVHALARRKNDFYLKAVPEDLFPYAGVREGLEWLRSRGIKTAVVSNAKRRELETALRLVGLLPLLDIVVSRDEPSAPKPDPAPYLHAAALLGLEPADCIGVEDSPTGLEAVLMAKMPGAGVLTNFPESALRQPVPGRPDLKPRWVFKTIQDFFSYLKTISA